MVTMPHKSLSFWLHRRPRLDQIISLGNLTNANWSDSLFFARGARHTVGSLVLNLLHFYLLRQEIR